MRRRIRPGGGQHREVLQGGGGGAWWRRGGDPGRARTCDPQFRKLMLYPAELRDRTRAGAPWPARVFSRPARVMGRGACQRQAGARCLLPSKPPGIATNYMIAGQLIIASGDKICDFGTLSKRRRLSCRFRQSSETWNS